MTVEILKDIFQNKENDVELDRLWYSIENHHVLMMRESDDIEALMESDWFNSQRRIIQETIYEFMLRSMNTSSGVPPKVIVSNKEDETCFSIKEAEQYLRQNFIILLENSLNDAHFLNALIRCFPKQSEDILKNKNEGWLKYGFGGGSTIDNVIQTELVGSFNQIFLKKEKYKYLRYFVIIDSDRIFPENELSQEKKNLIYFLEKNQVPYHVLEKREMENYIPDVTIGTIADYREIIDAYLRLNPLQKDYFDLEKGLRENKRYDQLLEGIQELYRNISEEDKKTFKKNKISDKYERKSKDDRGTFKTEFPKLFNHETVTRDSLLKRCQHHSTIKGEHPFNPRELPDLLERISKEL